MHESDYIVASDTLNCIDFSSSKFLQFPSRFLFSDFPNGQHRKVKWLSREPAACLGENSIYVEEVSMLLILSFHISLGKSQEQRKNKQRLSMNCAANAISHGINTKLSRSIPLERNITFCTWCLWLHAAPCNREFDSSAVVCVYRLRFCVAWNFFAISIKYDTIR